MIYSKLSKVNPFRKNLPKGFLNLFGESTRQFSENIQHSTNDL